MYIAYVLHTYLFLHSVVYLSISNLFLLIYKNALAKFIHIGCFTVMDVLYSLVIFYFIKVNYKTSYATPPLWTDLDYKAEL